MLVEEQLTHSVIGACIEVQREVGPGLLESAYEHCLCRELTIRNLSFTCQVPLPVHYKGEMIDCGYRLDIVVDKKVLLEIKFVEKLAPIHETQLLTYMKLGGYHVGLLINFNVKLLTDGIFPSGMVDPFSVISVISVVKMAAGCKKCDPHEICEECPEWIFTLADLIMCMMGLFVILWVLKPGPKPDQQLQASQELIETLSGIREAFGYVPNPTSNDPIDLHMLSKQISNMKLNGPGEKGKSRTSTSGAEGTDPEVTSIRTGKQSAVGGRLLFESGESKLTAETTRALDEIANEIRGHRNIVMVKGHTALDDFPDNATVSSEQKMDLSLRRAQAAADYLTGRGVSPDMIRVQGCSTFEPVLQRAYSPNAQSVNRRVEVEATSTLVPELQDNTDRSAQPTSTNSTPQTSSTKH